MEPIRGLLSRWETKRGIATDAPTYLASLNARLTDEGIDFALGPSYFMSELPIEDVFSWQVRPLLDEILHGTGVDSGEFAPSVLLSS